MKDEIIELLAQHQANVEQNMALWPENFFQNLRTYPIPFSGNIYKARVLTVGVNPAAKTEFRRGNGWPETMTTQELHDRLLNYFAQPDQDPHPWFAPWTEALHCLGVDYASGEAAHVDITPHATIAMSNVPNPDGFREMANRDILLLFKLISILKHVKLLLLAGAVTNRPWMDEFFQNACACHNPNSEFAVSSLYLGNGAGKSHTSSFTLSKYNRVIPAFFSSSGPKKRENLIPNICNNRSLLMLLLRQY